MAAGVTRSIPQKRNVEAEIEHEGTKKTKIIADAKDIINRNSDAGSGSSEDELLSEEDQEVDEYLFAEEEAAPRSSEKENAEPSRRSSEVEKEGSGSIREEKEEEEGYADSSEEEEEEDDRDEGTGIDSDGERGKNRFAEGSNAFRAAFSKIMEKKVSGDALGPVLSAHKKLIAKKLDEEASELKVKSEAKKEKRLLREKGHVKPESFLDAKEKSLIKLATKGVVKLFNAVSKAQSVQTGYDISKSRSAKAARKESKAAFLSELRGASLSSSLKPAQFSSVKAHSSPNTEIKNEPRGSVGEPGWAALRDDFMLTSSKLKDWDKMPDAAAIDDLDGMQDVNNGSSSSDED